MKGLNKITKFTRPVFNSYITHIRLTNRIGVGASFILGLLLFFVVLPLYNVTGVEDTEAATGTAKDSEVVFTSTRNTASVSLTTASTGGTFAKSVANSTDAAFNIYTNNSQGYKLQIKADSTVLKTSSSAADTTGLSAIASSRAEGSFAANTWGYLPNYYNSSTNTSTYYPITTSYVTLMDRNSANSSTNRDYFTIGLGAKADFSKASGKYTLGGNSSTISLYYVANPTTYSITFNKGNTTDTVNNMPYSSTSNTLSGNVSATSISVTDGVPTRTGYDFKGWCTVMPTTSNKIDSCSGMTYNASGAATWNYGIDRTSSNTQTLYAIWSIKTFTCTKQYKLQGADGNFPTSYTADGSVSVNYGDTCTYEKTVTNYRGSSTAANGAKGTVSATNVTSNQTLSLDFYRNTFTCSKQYRLQNADGTWGSYTADGSDTVLYGASCSYSKTVTNYKGSESGTNGSAGTASTSNVTANQTLSVSMYRNTYTVSVSNSNTTSGASSLTVRYGGSATVDVTPNSGYYLSAVSCPSGYSCTGYNTGASYTGKQTVTVTNNNSTNTSNTLSFTGAVACQTTVSGTMQDFNPCSTVADGTNGSLTDSRDNQIYTVKKINGQWWMTRNLAIGCNGSGSSYGSSVSSKTLTSANSNVSSNFSTPTALLSAASSSTQTADYSAGRMQCSSTYGAWYNYYAASAGTISTNSNSTVATYSICPSGWKLPTGPTTTSGTDFNKLVGTTGSGWQSPTDGFKAFGAVAGGRYNDGSLDYTGRGYWWSATAYNTTYRYRLGYNSSDGQFYGNNYNSRYNGYYVRCVRSS